MFRCLVLLLVARLALLAPVPAMAERVRDLGNAAEVLLAQTSDASLLVVGSRGRGGFAGLLLGSVSQQCLTHASVPTVVVTPVEE